MGPILMPLTKPPRDICDLRCYIEDALRYADYSHSFSDIAYMVDRGQLQYWPGETSVIITEILTYPAYSALNIFLAGGNLVELEAMYPFIEKFGESAGCDRVVVTGRKGWARTFLTKKEGFIEKLVFYEKRLDG